MTDVAQVMSLPIAQRLLRDESVLLLSYTALDGGPRVIPIAYVWDSGTFWMWTIPASAKVSAPRVAITLDIPGPPPRVLLARGQPTITTIDVPDGYLDKQQSSSSLACRRSPPCAIGLEQGLATSASRWRVAHSPITRISRSAPAIFAVRHHGHAR
jgi:hypothetical protein